MAPYTEARKRKEAFKKYRMALSGKAGTCGQHDAQIYILLVRNGKWYPIKGGFHDVSLSRWTKSCRD